MMIKTNALGEEVFCYSNMSLRAAMTDLCFEYGEAIGEYDLVRDQFDNPERKALFAAIIEKRIRTIDSIMETFQR